MLNRGDIISKRNRFKPIIYFLLFLSLPYWFEYFFYYFNWIIDNKDRLRYGLTAMFILLGLMLNAKAKLNDAKLLSKLQEEFGGRDKLIDALVRFAKMLEVMDSKELTHRILLVSELELDMRVEVIKLNDIFNTGSIDDNVEIELTKKQQRKLQKKIRGLLEIIDHKVEEEKMHEKPDLYSRLKKDIVHQNNIDEKYRKPQEKRFFSKFTKFV